MVEYPVDWKYCAIGKLARLKAGNDHFETSQCDGIYPWYGGNGIRGYSSCFTYDGIFPIVGRQGELCGNVKLAKGRFSATEHAVVVACGTEVLPDYFYYSLTFANLNQYATGCAQPGLSVQKICEVQMPTPPLPEQKRIAAVLSNADKLIANVEKRIAKKRAIKQGAMQELLTGKKRLPGFSGEWERKQFGDVLSYEQPQKYIVQNDEYVTTGIPVLTAGKSFVLGYTQEQSGIYNTLPVILFDDFLTVSRYVMVPFKVKSSAVKMLKAKDSNDSLYFIYASMQVLGFTPSDHQRHWIGIYSKFPIMMPEAEEQQAIAKVLSGMDAEIANLERKLEKLKLMKQGMMQDLLTGKVRLK